MISILSLVTSVKDYVEIVHKLIETDNNFKISNYSDLGPIITYTLITLKEFLMDIISLNWLKSLWDLPVIIPDISSAMISEISVLDGYFHNAFNFLDKPISYGETNIAIYSLEKFSVGLINSLFLCIPTGTTHLITLRRFLMQGLEAGYLAGLGSICGNILWISSIIFGWRFFVIPWLSLDIFRYLLGFVLLVKYMWDSYGDSPGSSGPGHPGHKKVDITTTSAKQKIFLLNFLLALTEQTSIYPFISNISIGSESSLLESFPAQNYIEFLSIHGSYILGLLIGCVSLLHLTCWFWENPAFKIYMWVISSFKISTTFYYKVLNFGFLYLTMICAISSIPYYGLDYTLTNPLGFVQDDRILDQKLILETSFLNTKASDRNTRRNRGRHGRRERWKRRIRKYRTFDASLYDQGVYDLFTIEDLNYGFDRFWLRRKMRNHRVRFRFFPGPWMRSFKKQLAKPRLESYAGPRQEFFRILFEQVYHPSFHEYTTSQSKNNTIKNTRDFSTQISSSSKKQDFAKSRASVLAVLSSNNSLKSERTLATNENLFSLLPKKEFSIYSTSLDSFKNSEAAFKGDQAEGRSLESLDRKQMLSNGSSKSSEKSSFDSSLSKEPLLNGRPLEISKIKFNTKENLKIENSTLRKFVRKINNRLKNSEIKSNLAFKLSLNDTFGNPVKNPIPTSLKKTNTSSEIQEKKILKSKDSAGRLGESNNNNIYSKRWKEIFSKISHDKEQLTVTNGQLKGLFKNFYQNSLTGSATKDSTGGLSNFLNSGPLSPTIALARNLVKGKSLSEGKVKKENSQMILSKQEKQILKYRSILSSPKNTKNLQAKSSGGQPQRLSRLSPGEVLEVFDTKKKSLPPDQMSTKKNLRAPRIPPISNNFSRTSTLLHPLKYYLKKQEAFERKLRYYTPTIFRKFSIENNAPYFRVMMKRYFYYFKPTLRWERTMKVASLRKARRKTSVSARKIQFSSSPNNFSQGKSLSTTNTTADISPADLSFPMERLTEPKAPYKKQTKISQNQELLPEVNEFKQARKIKATHNYTIVGKRASRFRYEIYKDVLQHWYYSPFNRLLLKFDIDLFIKRQPNSHFLTKNEEKLLHLRRFLLSEHYNTLRWYSYMQHYRSMKTKIGGTKSFASKVYNQQFSGTFKKIRHLFAITPSQSNQSVLKFDQPLYNESLNSGLFSKKNNLQKNLIIHEELLNSGKGLSQEENLQSLYSRAKTSRGPENTPPYPANFLAGSPFKTSPSGSEALEDYPFKPNLNGVKPSPTMQNLGSLSQNFDNKSLGLDLLNQSTQIVGTYLQNSNPIKQEYIKDLIENKDYLKLTQFLYKGQKIRGLKPITNERSLLNQEKEYLLTNLEKDEFKNLEKIKLNKMLRPLQQDLWINLLKRWKRKINDQEFLKNYLQRRIEKREKRKQKKERNLKSKLENLENWLGGSELKNDVPEDFMAGKPLALKSSTHSSKVLLTKNLQDGKAYKSLPQGTEGSSPFTTGVNNALIEGVLTFKNNSPRKEERINLSTKINTLNTNQSNLEITNSKKLFLKNISFIKREKELSHSIKKLTQIIKELNNTNLVISPKYVLKKNSVENLSSNRKHILGLSTKIKNIFKTYKYNSSKLIISSTNKLINIFKPITRRKKNVKNWQKMERSLNKQKRSRKEFKLFSKKPFQNNLGNQDYRQKYFDQKSDLPLNLSGSENKQDSTTKKAKKRDFSKDNGGPADFSLEKLRDIPTMQNLDILAIQQEGKTLKSNWKNIIKETYTKFQQSKFKRKKSPQRRARVRRNRGVTKKRTLSDSLKRELKNLRKYGEKMEGSGNEANAISKMDSRKQKIYLSFRNTIFLQKKDYPEKNIDGIFKQSPLLRRSKQKKQRFWKQKRSKYSQKSRKYKKRRRSVVGKVRILNKQLKRIQSTTELKNWWWKNFLPNLRSTTDSLLQFEKDRQIQQKLLELSIPEILERDKLNNLASPNWQTSTDMLQIGDFDFKPLSMPEAIRLREKNLILNKQSMSNSKIARNGDNNKSTASQKENTISTSIAKNNSLAKQDVYKLNSEQSNDIISKLSQTSLLLDNNNESLLKDLTQTGFISPNMQEKPISGSSINFVQGSPRLPLKQIFSSNAVPFYAGWDESLRKFVVTNRLLSRRSSGFEMRTMGLNSQKDSNLQNTNSGEFLTYPEGKSSENHFKLFSDAPLKGMNAATTLYWQIPFTTYDPDQFFALGMDGFAPLGWRRFQFRHSILKSWLMDRGKSARTITPALGGPLNKGVMAISTNKTNILDRIYGQNFQASSARLQNNVFNSSTTSDHLGMASPTGIKLSKTSAYGKNVKSARNIYRRLKKRYKRVKKHPRSPVWFPSGPLLNQVLPVHYIYIFYKRSRLPRDRYIKRRLRKSKTTSEIQGENLSSTNSMDSSKQKGEFSTFKNIPTKDFTLRKRVKTKRKYHIKQDFSKNAASALIPRRMKFIGSASQNDSDTSTMRWRPLSRQKINKPIAELIKEQRALKYKQRKKDEAAVAGNNKQPSNLRVKQLRRRVQRQIIRSVWRYRPRAGGFVWPGDYLKLEQVKAPKLNSSVSNLNNQQNPMNTDSKSISLKIKRKKKRNIQEWQIQPKKYLLEKHNLNAIKKKLEKANRSNKIRERIKEINLKF